MQTLDRREFIRASAAAIGAALGGRLVPYAKAGPTTAPATRPASEKPKRASDVVVLGKTGVKPSRLAIGTGTMSGREQRELGVEGLGKLLRHGLDQGVRWWETADSYGTHPHIQAALKQVKRDQVVITSKIRARDAAGARADLERFRKELNTDYIDIVLLHCQTEPDWPRKSKGAMEVLSEAKQKGWVRAVGCSFHDLRALQAAADEPWVEVVLARINPFAARMDVDKPQDVPNVERVLRTMHERGKVVYGMKILGQGDLKGDQIDASLRFAITRPYLTAFTVGFSRNDQIDDIIRRLDRVQAAT